MLLAAFREKHLATSATRFPIPPVLQTGDAPSPTAIPAVLQPP